METLASVIMPVYNEKESYLKDAIKSILGQSLVDFEFIIIDDGSSDRRVNEWLSGYAEKDRRIKLYNNPKNLGLTKTLNKALGFARGKYIARIDSDDMADPRRLEKQLSFMEKNPQYALCGSWSHIIDGNNKITGEKKFYTDWKSIRKKILFFNFFTHSSLFFRRDIAAKVGGYNENLLKAQDYDFILKIVAQYPVANIPEFLCSLRIHPQSISAKGKKKQEGYALIARWRAVWQYGFRKIEIFKIIPALFYFLLIPCFVKKRLINLLKTKKWI